VSASCVKELIPAASGGAFSVVSLEQIELKPAFLLTAMMLYVFSDYFCRDLVAHCSGGVSVFPQFPSPQPTLHLWVFSKYRSRTQTLESSYYLRNRISRRERAEDINMIRAYFHPFYRDVVVVSYFLKHLAHTICNRPLQDLLPVLWRPCQVIYMS
jgi:hypothetical protein